MASSSDHAIALQDERRILLIRSQKVMLDFDLAENSTASRLGL